MNEAFDGVLVTTGAVVLSMATKKLMKRPLVTPECVIGYVKLGVAVTTSTLHVKYAQEKRRCLRTRLKALKCPTIICLDI